MDIYNIKYKCEVLFRQHETNLLSNKLKPTEFVDKCLKMFPITSVPSCHNIMYKLLKTFVIARIHFILRQDCNNIVKAVANSSRSVAMKKSIFNVKNYKKY